MDSLLIYTQRREKRTVTMKLRSCDLSIIFFFAASHSPLKISQPPLKIPWPPPPPPSVGVFIQFTSIWRLNSLIWWASSPKASLGEQSIKLWLWWTYRRKESFQHDSAFPDIHAHKFNTLLPFDRTDDSLGRLLFSSFQWQATIINRQRSLSWLEVVEYAKALKNCNSKEALYIVKKIFTFS